MTGGPCEKVIRKRGAVVAAAVATVALPLELGVIAVVWTWSDPGIIFGRTPDFYVALTLMIGTLAAITPIGAVVVGWAWAPHATPGPRRFRLSLVLRVAWSATVLGATAIALPGSVVAVVGLVVRESEPLMLALLPLYALFTLVVGLLFFGWLAMIAAVPAAYVWLRIMLLCSRPSNCESEPMQTTWLERGGVR